MIRCGFGDRAPKLAFAPKLNLCQRKEGTCGFRLIGPIVVVQVLANSTQHASERNMPDTEFHSAGRCLRWFWSAEEFTQLVIATGDKAATCIRYSPVPACLLAVLTVTR